MSAKTMSRLGQRQINKTAQSTSKIRGDGTLVSKKPSLMRGNKRENKKNILTATNSTRETLECVDDSRSAQHNKVNITKKGKRMESVADTPHDDKQISDNVEEINQTPKAISKIRRNGTSVTETPTLLRGNKRKKKKNGLGDTNLTSTTHESVDDSAQYSKVPITKNDKRVESDKTHSDEVLLGDNIQENNGTIQIPYKEKRTRNRKQNKSTWPREITKSNRQHGKAYQGYQKNSGECVTHNKERPERQIGPRCNSNYCLKSSLRQCHEVDEEKRILLCKRFWDDLTWDQKEIYVASLVEVDDTKRKYADNSRRSHSLKYFLRIGNKRFQVCKQFFMSSLSLKEWMVNNWVTNNIDGIIPAKAIINARRKEIRPPSQKCLADREKKEFLLKFFEDLPKMPSHYCRQRTDKKYIEPNFQSLAQLYRYYRILCTDLNSLHLSYGYFCELFKDLKLGLYQPKKDRCDTCEGFDRGNIDVTEYNKHISQKERAKNEKNSDKTKAIDGKAHVFLMDVEAVQLCPVNKSGALYYKLKLKVHNFTIYELVTTECCNYWWHEGEGGMDASMFTTCIIKHLRDKCNDALPIIIWSDGCGYQNRNQILSNALLDYAIKTNKTVQQKFLVKGHTQMEVDSVHALIEKKLKNRLIDLPSDYIKATKEARLTLELEAKLLNHKDFKNYDDSRLFRYNSIRPGKSSGDDVVNDIRVINYSPKGIISTKVNFDDDFKPLPRKPKTPKLSYANLNPLYIEPPKISAKRFNDLQDLKSVLPSTAYAFYDNLNREY